MFFFNLIKTILLFGALETVLKWDFDLTKENENKTLAIPGEICENTRISVKIR